MRYYKIVNNEKTGKPERVRITGPYPTEEESKIIETQRNAKIDEAVKKLKKESIIKDEILQNIDECPYKTHLPNLYEKGIDLSILNKIPPEMWYYINIYSDSDIIDIYSDDFYNICNTAVSFEKYRDKNHFMKAVNTFMTINKRLIFMGFDGYMNLNDFLNIMPDVIKATSEKRRNIDEYCKKNYVKHNFNIIEDTVAENMIFSELARVTNKLNICFYEILLNKKFL